MKQLFDDIVERLELPAGERPERMELLGLDVLPHGVLEQPRFVRRELNADECSPQLRNGGGIHATFLPGPYRKKRVYA